MTTIMGLLNQIENDEAVLPAIQRDFVWSEAQTETLLDSVMRGYPIGIALLWETYDDIQYRSFVRDFRKGMLHTYRENNPPRRIRVVLDGQQRLQSLYIALHGTRDGNAVYFDVLSGHPSDDSEDERYWFDFLPAAEAEAENTQQEQDAGERDEYLTPTWWVSVRDLFMMPSKERRDFTKQLAERLKLSEEDAALLEDNLATFDEVFTRRQNILALSTIDEDLPAGSPYRKTVTDVLEIFVRVNREGTSLVRSDLIFSMLKLNWKESAQGLPEFVDAINNGNSFELDTDFVVRCLFAVTGLGGKLNIDLLRRQSNVVALQASYENCCSAIRATLDFVQSECQCQSSRLLGNSTVLVPIVHFVFGLPGYEIPNDQVDALRTAVYLLGFAKPFSRYGESRVGNFVREATGHYGTDELPEGGRTFPLELLIRRIRDWERIHSIEELAESNHLLTLHLIQGLSGAKVQYSKNSPEVDHIFPRSVLRERNVDEDDINDLANFWILAQNKNRNKSNRNPKQYFEDVSKTALNKALIDPELLEYRKFRRFIRERREAMLDRLEDKIGLTDADLERR